jgi:hypothetical protein
MTVYLVIGRFKKRTDILRGRRHNVIGRNDPEVGSFVAPGIHIPCILKSKLSVVAVDATAVAMGLTRF